VIHEKKSHNFYLGILFFGALGGLISALGRRESLGNLSEFYLGRLSLFLRPFLGSALAGVVYLAVQGGLFSFLAIKSESPRPALLVLSFLAGFLERAVVEHLLWPGGPDLSEKGVTYA
jgi:hypothetical protein